MEDDKTMRSALMSTVTERLKLLYRKRPGLTLAVTAVAALLIGLWIGGGDSGSVPAGVQHDDHAASSAEPTVWTCSMHPQIQLPEAGQCPICFMDLIPLQTGGGGNDGPRQLSMTESSRQLARIVTAPVERRFVSTEIRMVGRIEYDETQLRTVTARFPGRLDRLFVDYTGMTIRAGEHLAEIYSPELLAAEQELIQAAHAVKAATGRTAETTARLTLDAAREKLRLWELTPTQVSHIEASGEVSDRQTIYSPITGVVVRKHVSEGSYVKTGGPLYAIADLSHLWLLIDAYESDLTWLRYGQKVEFTTEAYPGVAFEGTITFIDPILDAKTRTVKLRVAVANPDGRLKPAMFVRAVVKPDIAAGGRVMDPALSGKWICPMHPEVIDDNPGDCSVCGMPLVTTESLGYVAAVADSAAPLVIPATAPLITGKRAVVYVELPDRDRPTYEGRDIVLGPRAGDHYIVAAGLTEGEPVVVNGAFKLDSELQLRGKTSMMNPAPPKPDDPSLRDITPFVVGDGFLPQLTPLYGHYFDLQQAMADDTLATALDHLRALAASFDRVDIAGLRGDAHTEWLRLTNAVTRADGDGQNAASLDDLRVQFEIVSNALIDIQQFYGHAGEDDHYIVFCPMAFDNIGAYWLQNHDKVTNPYFGAKMLRCGSVKASYAPRESETGSPKP